MWTLLKLLNVVDIDGFRGLHANNAHKTNMQTPEPGAWFNIKMLPYQYGKSHCGDKTAVRSSYLHNGIDYTCKMSSLYWIRAQGPFSISVLERA